MAIFSVFEDLRENGQTPGSEVPRRGQRLHGRQDEHECQTMNAGTYSRFTEHVRVCSAALHYKVSLVSSAIGFWFIFQQARLYSSLVVFAWSFYISLHTQQ